MSHGSKTEAACLKAAFAAQDRMHRKARRHLDSLPAERRAQLEADWMEGEREGSRTPHSPEILARAEAEWRAL